MVLVYRLDPQEPLKAAQICTDLYFLLSYDIRNMNEAKISPLARRLAEENGIDWRHLAGTGPDGSVVEKDILSYLARVMAGEVMLPPMVEESSPAPDEYPDIAQMQAMLDGIEQREQLPSAAEIAAVEAPVAPPAPIFSQPANPTLGDLDVDLDLDISAPVAAPVAVTPDVPMFEAPVIAPQASEPLPTGAFLNSDFNISMDQPEVATPKVSIPEVSMPTLDISVPPTPTPKVPAAPDLVWETNEIVPSAPAPVEIETSAIEPGMTFSSPEPVIEMPKIEEISIPEATLPSVEEILSNNEELVSEVVPSYLEAAPIVEELDSSISFPEDQTDVVVTPDFSPAAIAASAPISTPSWHRLVDLRPATDAAKTLSDSWGKNVDISAFLFRAAEFALSESSLSLHATKGVLEGSTLKSYRVSPAHSIKGILDALDGAGESFEGLTVLDLSASGFDQAIFPGKSVLSIGRALGHHALLSVSGDVNPHDAAALLEKVEYYLERPILLA